MHTTSLSAYIWFIYSVILGALPAAAATGIPTSPTAFAALPAIPSQSDAVQLAIGGLWSDACIPEYESHQVADGVITIILVTVAEVCGQVETEWSVTVELGQLDAGPYDVELVGALQETHALFVAKESWYLPRISL